MTELHEIAAGHRRQLYRERRLKLYYSHLRDQAEAELAQWAELQTQHEARQSHLQAELARVQVELRRCRVARSWLAGYEPLLRIDG